MEIHFRKSGYPCEANRIKYNLNKLKLFSRKLVRYVKDYLFNNVFLKVFTKYLLLVDTFFYFLYDFSQKSEFSPTPKKIRNLLNR